MKLLGIAVLLILAPPMASGEVPESIVGVWHFDLVRTMSEHIDRAARANPDLLSAEVVEAHKASLPDSAEANPLHTLTITEDTIISPGVGAGSTAAPYVVVGGNSRLVIIESTHEDGYKSVINIRLIDEGIAIETTNCRERPEQCERERQRAIEQVGSHADGSPRTSEESIAAGSDESTQVGATSSPPPGEFSQPRWVYFKRSQP